MPAVRLVMLDVSRSLEDAAEAFLAEIAREQRPAGFNGTVADDDGTVYVRGGMVNATGGRDYHLSIVGLSREDVTSFRRLIKKQLGFEPPCALAEALLVESRSKRFEGRLEDERKARAAAKKEARRKAAAAQGFCRICCRNAAGYDANGEQLKTCEDCRDRVKRHRASKRT